MLTNDDMAMTDEDYLIYRRVTGVMTQTRYVRDDRRDAEIAGIVVGSRDLIEGPLGMIDPDIARRSRQFANATIGMTEEEYEPMAHELAARFGY